MGDLSMERGRGGKRGCNDTVSGGGLSGGVLEQGSDPAVLLVGEWHRRGKMQDLTRDFESATIAVGSVLNLLF